MPKGVRFERNLCLGVWKFSEPHIDVIQNHVFRHMKIFKISWIIPWL